MKMWTKYILLVTGMFYTILPHTIHIKYAPDYLIGIQTPHIIHVIIGITLLIFTYHLFDE